LSEETVVRPKPMVEIGGRPILWHIMKIYSHFGFNDFIVCLGYKGYLIKEYFANYYLHMSDVTIDIKNNQTEIHHNFSEPWKISLIDTGDNTMTGGRVKRIKDYIGDETFMLTYGDGVSDVNLSGLLNFHARKNKIGTITAIRPPGRFGALRIEGDDTITSFLEKPRGDGGYVNGGFFVFEPELFDYLRDDATILEREPLESLARQNQLNAFKHEGFWHAMDTLRDKNYLEELWAAGRAGWKVWD
jgi:glucose-1-phosphate cytidylyltransferase